MLLHSESFARGSGDTALIMIHGFADLPYGWSRVAERLTNSHDVACHAIRVPRWGQPLKEQRDVRMGEIRAEIDEKIEELSANHKNIWLVGHSLGSALAIDAIPRNQERIDGLIALAPLIRVSNRRVPVGTARFWYHLGTRVLWLARTFESPFTERLVAADDPNFNYAVDKFIPYSVYDILFEVTKENLDVKLPETLPVFCAVSTSDKVIDTDAARNWYNTLKGPKELYVDEVSAHALHVGENWKEITDKMGVFIQKNSVRD